MSLPEIPHTMVSAESTGVHSVVAPPAFTTRAAGNLNFKTSPFTIGMLVVRVKVYSLISPLVVLVRVKVNDSMSPAIEVAMFFLYPMSISLTPSVS